MERHFDQELEALKGELLRMSSLAEQAVAVALKALTSRDAELAEKVDRDDAALDELQVQIDDRCVQLLALRQPAASDLRFIMMATKFTTDLERIGDQAVNIARRSLRLDREPSAPLPALITEMAGVTCGMIHDVLDAFVYQRPETARAVIQRDKQVDKLDHQVHDELTSDMLEDPSSIVRAVHLINIAHSLERIGDHASNLAEEIVYLYEARDIRHQNP